MGQEFSSVKLGLGQLLGLLPSNKPRYYSISSSPKVSPSAVTVTVNVVDGIAPTGRRHLGLCSNFLKEQPKQVPPTVHPSNDVRFAAFCEGHRLHFPLAEEPKRTGHHGRSWDWRGSDARLPPGPRGRGSQ